MMTDMCLRIDGLRQVPEVIRHGYQAYTSLVCMPWNVSIASPIVLSLVCTPWKGNLHIAQGNALGSLKQAMRPVRAKASKYIRNAFALSGRALPSSFIPRVPLRSALGYEQVALSGRPLSLSLWPFGEKKCLLFLRS